MIKALFLGNNFQKVFFLYRFLILIFQQLILYNFFHLLFLYNKFIFGIFKHNGHLNELINLLANISEGCDIE